jgi:hypothetical protein
MKPIKKITIKDEKYEDGYSDLYAKIAENGDLVLDGCDAGELVEQMFGDWDYEYWLTIPEKFKDTILLNLIKDRFTTEHEFRKWLDQLEIPSEFSFY